MCGFVIGDCVFGEGYIMCGFCCNCCVGCWYLCCNMVGVGVNCEGVFVEYLVILVFNVFKILLEIFDDFVLIFDLFGNVMYMVLLFNFVGEDVLIIGVGLIGIMVVVIVKYVGVCNVVIIDINDYWFEFVCKMGVMWVVNVVCELLCDVMVDLYMIEGFDVGFEMLGVLSVFMSLFEVMNYGGKVVLFGILFV